MRGAPDDEGDDHSENTVDEEQPLPALKPGPSAQTQKAARHQATDGVCDGLGVIELIEGFDLIKTEKGTCTPQNQASLVASSVLL